MTIQNKEKNGVTYYWGTAAKITIKGGKVVKNSASISGLTKMAGERISFLALLLSFILKPSDRRLCFFRFMFFAKTAHGLPG